MCFFYHFEVIHVSYATSRLLAFDSLLQINTKTRDNINVMGPGLKT